MTKFVKIFTLITMAVILSGTAAQAVVNDELVETTL